MISDALRRVLLDHHPMQRTKESPLTGCYCGQVGLGEDVIAHVAEQVLTAIGAAALDPPVPAQQEPACLWAHGPITDLDSRGLCPVCAEDEL